MRSGNVCALLITAALCGCYTVNVKAPPGATMVLADEEPRGREAGKITSLYFVSGLAHMHDFGDKPSGCSRVSVKTEMSIVDGIITGGIGVLSYLGWSVVGAALETPQAPGVGTLIATAGWAGTSLVALPSLRTTTYYCHDRPAAPALLPAPASPSAPARHSDAPIRKPENAVPCTDVNGNLAWCPAAAPPVDASPKSNTEPPSQ